MRAFDTRKNFTEVSLPEEWQHGNLLAISPNGTDLAIVSQNRFVLSLWRLGADDHLIRMRVPVHPSAAQITSVSYSADGGRLLIRYSIRDFVVLLANGARCQDISLPQPDSYLTESGFSANSEKDEPDDELTEISPDGRILLATKRVFCDLVQPQRLGAIWDVSGACPELLRKFPSRKDAMAGAAFSPDGRWIAVGHDRQVSVWDLAHSSIKGAASYVISLGSSNYAAMVFDQGSSHLAVSGIGGAVFLDDLRHGPDLQPTPHANLGEIQPLFSRSGRWLVTAAFSSQTIRLCDVSRNCEGVEGPETVLKSSEGCAGESGRWIAGLREVDELEIVFDGNRELLRTTMHLPWTAEIDDRYISPLSAECSSNRKWMFVRALPTGSKYLFNISRTEPKIVDITGIPANLKTAQFDPSGNWLILTSFSARGRSVVERADAAVTVRLTDSSTLLAEPLLGYSGGEISFSPGGSWMVEQPQSYVARGQRAADPLLRRINASSIGEPAKIAGPGNPLSRITFTDHDTALLGTEKLENEYSPDSFEAPNPPVRAFLWDLSKGLASHPAVISGHHGAVNATFSPDGSWLATTDGIFQQRMKDVQLWHTNDLTHSVFAFQMEAPAQIFYPMFDPAGKWFIFGKGRTAAFYSLDQLDRLRRERDLEPDFEIESGALVTAHWHLKFSPDGRWFVNEGNNTPVRIWWRSAGDKVLLKGEASDQHDAELAFTHDSEYLITSDGSTAIWTLDSSTGSIWRAKLPGGGSILLSPDERRFTTITPDGPRNWTLVGDELVALARNVVARNMSLDEWTQVLPGVPYEKTFAELPVDVSVIQSYVEQANTAANSGNRADARKWISLAAATAIDSKNPFAAIRVADAGLSQGLAQSVLGVAEFAAGAMPNDPGAMELRGISRVRTGDSRGAEDLRRFVSWALTHGATQGDLKEDLELIQTAKNRNDRSPN